MKIYRAAAVCCLLTPVAIYADSPRPLDEVVAEFHNATGAKLVFEARELPPGKYHDVMTPLSASGRLRAAEIACREMRKLPQGYLGKIGLESIGIFAACASRDGDRFHTFDEKLGGYRYFGIYNGQNALAAAYYTDEQLPLTLHHEIFHHVDRLAMTREKPHDKAADHRIDEILDGKQPYLALEIEQGKLAALGKRSQGQILIETVSQYAGKNVAEDKAETARYFMSTLADSLVQMAQRPQLPGSQRLLHVLDRYGRVPGGNGPDAGWFVELALGNQPATRDSLDVLAARLYALHRELQAGAADAKGQIEQARSLLDKLEKTVSQAPANDAHLKELLHCATLVTHDILRASLQPKDGDRQFIVRGQEDSQGINWTLRSEVTDLGHDASRLQRIARAAGGGSSQLAASQLVSLRLLARYYAYIAARWPVTQGTEDCFERTRLRMLAVVTLSDSALADRLSRADLSSLADGITPEGALAPASHIRNSNPYLASVDREIEDPVRRKIMRGVQPACVRINRASGVNIAASGLILTASHVALRLDEEMTAEFPDGRSFAARCIAIDHRLDVALCRLEADVPLPFATLAPAPPERGDRVVCIGQPGAYSPRTGEATGYEPFDVSVGQIQGFAKNRLAGQTLGGTMHNAWTYWGHSGSPLFNDQGQIVAMHNSWDSTTAMRHAVTYEAIVKFLGEQKETGLGIEN